MPGKVMVALSGGVDSSVAAALLKGAGYEVHGLHLRLWDDPKHENTRTILIETGERLGISINIINAEVEFQKIIISYFCREYGAGRTPNPCPVCNKLIKFRLLLEKAGEIGAEYIATGHYARVENSAEGYRLLKAADSAKDQSYFLYALGQDELEHAIFPLGGINKTEVKKLAAERGLPTAQSKESHDICFIPGGDYRSFLAKCLRFTTGDIVDTRGEVLGRHIGLANYTVGQRQGLGVSAGERRYVIRLDTEHNRLVLGGRDQLLGRRLLAGELSWVAGKPPPGLTDITAKIRYQSPEAPVRLEIHGDAVEVEFASPQSAITPGQAIVFYRGEIVLGGGIMEAKLD
jgi:tRNA-specific 2-thiouridylase